MRVDERVPAGQRADLGQELSASMGHERRHVAQSVALAQRHASVQQDEHAARGLSRRDEPRAARIALALAEAADARDLRVGQLGKHLMASGLDPDRQII